MGSTAISQFGLFGGYYNTINGVSTSTSHTRHGVNPATEKPNPEVPISTRQDVDRAITAGQAAFKGWASTPYSERKVAVVTFAEALDKHKQDFAKLLTQEQGKPVMVRPPQVGS